MYKIQFHCAVIGAFIATSSLFMSPAFAADFENILLIGRPETGGVNVEQIPSSFSQATKGVFWYLDPRTEGAHSITGMFPCPIPEDRPQRFETVCLEQGMLNEVVTHFESISLPSPPIANTEVSSNFSQEDEMLLEQLCKERNVIWERWRRLQDVVLKEAQARVISKALEMRLIEESWEHGDLYYRIIGERNTARVIPTVNSLFIKHKGVFEEEAEIEKIQQDIAVEFERMCAKDKITDPMWKRKDGYREDGSRIETSPVTVQVPMPERRNPEEVAQHIQSFLLAAWNLVAPGGTMIVFSGNGRVDGTALAAGITEECLRMTLPELVGVSEIEFEGQRFEGEQYISNPIFPALTDRFGWAGPRPAGSYFLVKKSAG